MYKRAAWYGEAHLKHVWKKASSVHHLESVRCTDWMLECFSAFRLWVCTGHFHFSLCYSWPYVNRTDIKSILQTMACTDSQIAFIPGNPWPSPSAAPYNYYENIQLPGAESWRCFYTNHSEIATISVKAQSSIIVESSFNSRAELGVKIAILLVPSHLWRMHSALYSEKKVVWLVKLVVIMIINDSNSKRGVSRERRCMFCLCVIERHLQVAQCREAVWVGVGWLCQRTYFPRAKHSSLTVMPLAASTVWGKCASILGSYSPITPKKKNKTRHAQR